MFNALTKTLFYNCFYILLKRIKSVYFTKRYRLYVFKKCISDFRENPQGLLEK